MKCSKGSSACPTAVLAVPALPAARARAAPPSQTWKEMKCSKGSSACPLPPPPPLPPPRPAAPPPTRPHLSPCPRPSVLLGLGYYLDGDEVFKVLQCMPDRCPCCPRPPRCPRPPLPRLPNLDWKEMKCSKSSSVCLTAALAAPAPPAAPAPAAAPPLTRPHLSPYPRPPVLLGEKYLERNEVFKALQCMPDRCPCCPRPLPLPPPHRCPTPYPPALVLGAGSPQPPIWK